MGCLNSKISIKINPDSIQSKNQTSKSQSSSLVAKNTLSLAPFQQTVNSVLTDSKLKVKPFCSYPPSKSDLKLPPENHFEKLDQFKSKKKNNHESGEDHARHFSNKKAFIRAPLNRKLIEDSPLSISGSPNTQGWITGLSIWDQTPNKSSSLELKELDIGHVSKEKGEKWVNQYKISVMIGCGAYGKVYKAFDAQGKTIAMKVYDKRVIKNRWIGKKNTAISQIMNEIKVMQSISHPNILSFYEVIDHDESNKLYISQEYMSKGSISENIPVSEKTAQLYFNQIISAVDYLHNTLNLVHRDLKPENFLLNNEDTVKVCGFSLAEPFDTAQGISGTYAYLPPEIYKSQISLKEADVWALGISLYYMVEGKLPIINKEKNTEIEIPENFSHELKDLLLRIFEKNPEKRVKVQDIFKTEWMVKEYL